MHNRISIQLVATTIAVLLGLEAGLFWALDSGRTALVLGFAVGIGVWLDRLYVVAHEASHFKLFPRNRWANDLAGGLLTLPVLVPITAFRKIHLFHHGQNRRTPELAALDVFVVDREPGRVKRAYLYASWYLCVFCGGFFLHSLATVAIMLLLPTKTAVRISPAFIGWSRRQRLIAWGETLCGAALHLAVWRSFGAEAWFFALGLPILVFAWLWSILLYVYHYRATIGAKVGWNARSLPRQRFFSWLLLNFNEHVTHHADPRIPWYELPQKRMELPETHGANATGKGLASLVLAQLAGPTIVVRRKEAS